MARRRRCWQALQAGLDPQRLVFIDETWIKTNMVPLRGWAPKGQRLRGFAPQGRWRTLTFLGALRWDGITAPCIFDGPINGQSFRAYVYRCSCRLCSKETSSFWTISAATKPRPCARCSRPSARGFGICRPTHRISTRSKRPSPRSSTGCASPRSAPLKASRATSESSSRASDNPNAANTSKALDMLTSKRETH